MDADAFDAAELTLREKVGQLFVIGFDGTEPTDAARELLTDWNAGGVIYFSRNLGSPAQVADLSRELRTIATSTDPAIPPLLTIDQEGGAVSRTDWGTEQPAAMCLGAADDADLAAAAGGATGRELDAVGIDLNLAPVLDVNNNPDNPVIGVRSFGEDPERVARLGTANAAGMEVEDVAACGKHFPGHGDTGADSHHELPVVDHDRERLDRVEFPPFRRAIDEGIEAIMTTHVAFPTVTGDDRPATISEAAVGDLLREDLGFDGLVVSDGMEMAAIADGVGTPEGCVRAIEAGVDLLLVCHTPETQRASIDAVVEAVESGRIDEARVDAALERVLDVKARYVNETAPSAERWEAVAGESRETAREVGAAGVTLAREGDAVPLDTDRPLHLVGFEGVEANPADEGDYEPSMASEALAEAGFDVTLHVPETAAALPELDEGAQVLVALSDARHDDRQPATVAALHEQGHEPVVWSVRTPYDLSTVPAVETALVTYDYTPGTLAAVGAVLAGEREAPGRLPVTVPEF